MSKELKIVPELRFLEFEADGEWEIDDLGNHCFITTGRLDANAMVEDGKYRFYTCAKDYYFIDDFAFDTNALLISGNGAHVGYIHHYHGKFNAYQRTYVLDDFDKDIHYIQYFLERNLKSRIASEKKDGNTPYIVKSTLGEMKILSPKRELEQQKIASCLSSLDELIATHNDKLEALKDHKKGLMQNLFPQEGETVPKYRFKEFEGDGEWEIRSIEESIDLISGIALKSEELSDDKSGTPILRGINITEGQIRHSEEMDKFYLGDISEIEKYLVEENDIVIGMDGSKVGKNVSLIAEKDTDSILIQRVARIKAVNSEVNYLYQHFVSDGFRRYVDIVNTSSGIPHISAKQIRDFEIGFPPKILEQQKTAYCLSAVDELITAQAEKIEQLQIHKKGLMQGLFPNPSANSGETIES